MFWLLIVIFETLRFSPKLPIIDILPEKAPSLLLSAGFGVGGWLPEGCLNNLDLTGYFCWEHWGFGALASGGLGLDLGVQKDAGWVTY